MPDTLAVITITIMDGGQISWDIDKLDIPNAVFWLEFVKSKMLDQISGDDSVVRTDD